VHDGQPAGRLLQRLLRHADRVGRHGHVGPARKKTNDSKRGKEMKKRSKTSRAAFLAPAGRGVPAFRAPAGRGVPTGVGATGVGAALLVAGLCALEAGCGDAQGQADTPGPQYHGSAPNLNLANWKHVPLGDGLRRSAGAAGTADTAVNYGLALRTAALKLSGELPTLDQIMRMDAAIKSGRSDGTELDPQALYGTFVQGYINDTPRFTRQMMQYWRDTLRMGGSIQGVVANTTATMMAVNLELAPNFATRLTVEGKDMRLLFTQDKNTCPAYTPATGAFADGSCQTASGLAEGSHAGILTHPAFLAQYYGSMGFRRVRLVQELFACHKFPAEFTKTPTLENGVLYTSPWPKESISSAIKPPTLAQRTIRNTTTTPKNSAIPVAQYKYVSFDSLCVSCHGTINHVAPLFMNFDATGFLRATPMVQVPIDDNPFAQISDYLPAGAQQTYWRKDVPTPDLKTLGQAVAADPDMAQCMITRAWNNAFSKADVVNDLAVVPDVVVKDLTDAFVKDGYNLKRALYQIYTHPNFIRY
jgi:hypothetical protein